MKHMKNQRNKMLIKWVNYLKNNTVVDRINKKLWKKWIFKKSNNLKRINHHHDLREQIEYFYFKLYLKKFFIIFKLKKKLNFFFSKFNL